MGGIARRVIECEWKRSGNGAPLPQRGKRVESPGKPARRAIQVGVNFYALGTKITIDFLFISIFASSFVIVIFWVVV